MTLTDVSNPDTVFKRAKQIFGDSCLILPSTKKDKKYMLFDKTNRKFVHFGSIKNYDYTKYLDLYGPEIAKQHRERYLKRATKIKGNWYLNPCSPNWLSIHILWMLKPNLDIFYI